MALPNETNRNTRGKHARPSEPTGFTAGNRTLSRLDDTRAAKESAAACRQRSAYPESCTQLQAKRANADRNKKYDAKAKSTGLPSAKHSSCASAKVFDGELLGDGTKEASSKKNPRKKMIFSALAILLMVVLGIGMAFVSYYGGIKDKLRYDGDIDALKGVLTGTDYQEPFYVLVIGSDNWQNYGARSDAMVLARVDLNVPQITMVSVPRDTPYQINGEKVKLNQVFAEQGEIACIDAVSQLTGVEISHYVEVEFDQLEQVVDSLGGIKVNVPYSIDYQVYTLDEPVVHIEAGEQVLTGEQAVALARMRTAYSNAGVSEDAIRQANIRTMMIGIMKQILEQPVSDIPNQIQALATMIQTDIPLEDLISWATRLAKAESVAIYSCTGPTEGGIDAETELWLTEEAPEQWAELMGVVNSGEDPSAVFRFDESTDGVVHLGSTEIID